MQRLGRGAVSLYQLHRVLALEPVRQAQRVQWASGVSVGAAQSVAQQLQGWQQVELMHSSAARSCTHHTSSSSSAGRSWPSSSSTTSSSSSSRHHPWQRFFRQQHWQEEASLTTGTLTSSSSRPYSTTSSPQQQSATAEDGPAPAAAAAKATAPAQPNRGPELDPAAEPKALVGICRRRNIKCGWKKIDFVLRMIRRATVDDAMAQLSANPKRAAMFVKHAVANARNNAICAGGDPQKLYVAEAFVTKGRYTKRVHFMSRGYSSLQETCYSHLNVRVQQMDDAAAAAATLRRRPRVIAPIMQRLQHGRRMPRRLLVRGWDQGWGGSGEGGGRSSGRSRQQVAVA